MSKKSINILSIDGGGIRGLMSAEILVYVEKKLKELYNSNDIKLTDHFDYLAGTSTGGILTALYAFPDENGKSKYSALDASNLYFKHGGDIFKKGFRFYLTLGGLFTRRYSVKPLEKLFQRYFNDIKIDKAVKPLMITSVDTISRELYLFKSYKRDDLFRDSVRATSAAPTYFKSLKIGEGKEYKSLIDGGFAINNPSISSVVECLKLFPNIEKINMLSIGTGPKTESYSYKKVSSWGIITGASKLFEITLTSMSKATQYQISKLYKDNMIKGEFLRVQPKLYGASHKMDKVTKKNLGLLKKAGQLSVLDYKSQIDDFLIKTINTH